MSHLIRGRALSWGSYDPPGIITAAVSSVLDRALDQGIRQRLRRIQHPQEMVDMAAEVGLAIWSVESLDELTDVCEAVAASRERRRNLVAVVRLSPQLNQGVPILAESGAQIVATQVISIQRALRQAVPRISLSHQGYHPLTSGLLQRLPWPELDTD